MSSDHRSTTPTTQIEPESKLSTRSSFFSERSLRQFGVYAGGTAFFGLAALLTRRSLIARHRASIPRFYQPSNVAGSEVNGALDALDALSLATVNVTGLTLMLGGGALWAADISSPEELKTTLRGKLGLGPGEGGVSEVDREAEEWLASILERGEGVKDSSADPAAGAKGKGLESLLGAVLARKVKEQKAKADERSKDY